MSRHLGAVARSSLVLAVVGTTLSGVDAAALSATAPGTHTVTIMDDYFHIPAGSVAVPDGWKFAGTVMRVPGCHGSPFLSVEFSVATPDGMTEVAALPGATWQYSTSPQMLNIMAHNGCPGVNIQTAADFLANIVVPNLHPGATIIKVSPGGALIQQTVQNMQSVTQAANQKPSITGAAVRIQYDRGGHLVDEELGSVVSCSYLHSMAMFASPASTTTTCNTYGISLARAPAGHLDEFLNGPAFGQILSSAKTDNVWLHRMVNEQNARFQAATADFNRIAAANLAQLKAEGDARVARAQEFDKQLARSTQSSMNNAQAAQNARTAAAHQVVNFASDRADYINPATGQVLNLDYNANHSWGSSDGRNVVLNADAGYDPNGSVNPVQSSWVELIPKN
jgi:hypothetical protein